MIVVIMTAKHVQFKKQAKCKSKTLKHACMFIAGHLTNLSRRTVTVQWRRHLWIVRQKSYIRNIYGLQRWDDSGQHLSASKCTENTWAKTIGKSDSGFQGRLKWTCWKEATGTWEDEARVAVACKHLFERDVYIFYTDCWNIYNKVIRKLYKHPILQ